ncbi:MAG: hypothetical protein U1F76_30370 [Candidatus Competibacteraceae bacterium]
MTLDYSIIAGLVSGCLGTGTIFYLTAYRRLRKNSNEKEAQLMQLKAECEELSSTVFHLETQRQLDQQKAAKEKIQLSAELQECRTDKVKLENQYAKDNSNWNKEWEVKSEEIEQLHIQVAQLTREKNILESKINQSAIEHAQQKENGVLEANQLQARIERLTRERTELRAKLEELNAVLEQERLGFDLQLSQLKNVVKKLEYELYRAKQEKTTFRERENPSLQTQLQQLKSEKIGLEQKIRIQSSQIQALAAEIKQLMEKLQTGQVYHIENN